MSISYVIALGAFLLSAVGALIALWQAGVASRARADAQTANASAAAHEAAALKAAQDAATAATRSADEAKRTADAVRDVNLAAGHVEVRQTLQRTGGEWRTGTPKSARSTRNVPLMHRGLTADLRRLLLTHPESGNPDALFWPGRTHGSHAVDWSRPLDTGSFLRNYMRPALDRVGLPQMRLHDLRHTYASLMLAARFSAFEVSRFMGHASASTTSDLYGGLIPVDRTEQISRFEAFVAGG